MRLDTSLKLRRIGRHHMIVKAGDGRMDLTDVFTLNDTAAWLWNRIGTDSFTPETLAAWLCGEYDVDPGTALRDVESMLEEWRRYGLLLDE